MSGLANPPGEAGTDTLVTLSATALLPTALTVLDGSSLKRLVVGSIAGGLPTAKSLLYRLFKKSEVTALPDDPRVIRFSALIANDGRPDPAPVPRWKSPFSSPPAARTGAATRDICAVRIQPPGCSTPRPD